MHSQLVLTDVRAVFGAADGLRSLTLLYDTRERSSQSLAVTKRWTVLSPAASFFLAKTGREDIFTQLQQLQLMICGTGKVVTTSHYLCQSIGTELKGQG